jgi:hypothetical protein
VLGRPLSFHWSGAAAGYRLSFMLCALLVALGITLAWLRLPKRPRVDYLDQD